MAVMAMMAVMAVMVVVVVWVRSRDSSEGGGAERRGEEKSEWEGEERERERSMWAAARILALRESQPYTLELTSHTSGSVPSSTF